MGRGFCVAKAGRVDGAVDSLGLELIDGGDDVLLLIEIRVPNSPPAQPKTSWTGGLFNSALRTGGLWAG